MINSLVPSSPDILEKVYDACWQAGPPVDFMLTAQSNFSSFSARICRLDRFSYSNGFWLWSKRPRDARTLH